MSRPQLVVYVALAIVGLLLGARWVRASEAGPATEAPPFASGEEGGEPSGAELQVEAGTGDVVVHVVGAVARPGVYRLPGGTRVAEAVKRAGGASRDAALDGINLAAKLADGQQVVVPSAAPGPSSPATAAGEDGPISLGTATVEELDTIQGIGPVTAQQIVEFRDERGGLSSVEELDEISGIGPATMDALAAALQP